jgi:superfamily II RNA helicase
LGIAMPPFKAASTLVKRDLSRSMPAKWTGKAPRECKVGMTSEEFQLLHCGELMDRDMDSQPDSRVGFNPDAWQRRVLDQLDSGNSVFVVAPTSAGKTFISFYAMEQALRANDDSILVYIAPTKALVNQIAAEVISRFRKNYQHAGKTVWAIHSGDYSMNNPKKCQVLITVPSILQSMLLSPSNANIWAPRIKRIIFDEVHSIGSAEDGLIWEQLLLLAPCPIIALSATVGNPDEFSSWLEASQKMLGIDMTMVRHPHRYSDLRKFVYLGPPSSAMNGHFKGLVKPEQFAELENIAELRRIHPVSALLDVVHTHIPPDLVLEPRDCLELYLAMKKFETPEYTVPKEIDYRNFFGQTGQVIKKAQVLQWEVVLKEVLQKWMQDSKSPFSKVVHELAHVGGDKAVKQEENDKLAVLKSKTMNDYLMETTLPLLSSLNSTAALPAILFSYDRVTCEQLCEALNGQLEAAEKEWRDSDPKWKAKLKDWKAYQEQKAYIAGKRSTGKGSKEDTKADRMRDEAEAEMNSLEFFDPEEPSIEFSFADPRKHSKEELKQDIETLSWGRNKQPLPEFFINALKRGVGVHHAGMSRKYRQSVEMLFRKGFLRVVIATGTLALGINMPCRTVVFAGDSVYLTALNYRQASVSISSFPLVLFLIT